MTLKKVAAEIAIVLVLVSTVVWYFWSGDEKAGTENKETKTPLMKAINANESGRVVTLSTWSYCDTSRCDVLTEELPKDWSSPIKIPSCYAPVVRPLDKDVIAEIRINGDEAAIYKKDWLNKIVVDGKESSRIEMDTRYIEVRGAPGSVGKKYEVYIERTYDHPACRK